MNSWFAWAALLGIFGTAGAASLTWERTIPLPGVEGRIDHFAADAAGDRLFIAALGNDTVEVIDLKAGAIAQSIRGLAEPQGLCYFATRGRLYVANGRDGAVRVFDGKTLAPVATVKFDDDADNLRGDPATGRLYVGHGDGALGVIDVASNQIVADIALPAHPESFQLETNGPRVFVNVPGARRLAVIDRRRHAVVASWSTGAVAANFPMALDEPHHRLFVGCRNPARLLVLDTESGAEVAQLELHRDCDDLFLDARRRRLYASCGEGYLDVFAPSGAGRYAREEAVTTAPGARTCFLDGDHLYLAVPKRGDTPAAVWCYRAEPASP
ncbi:MAG TPA: YncE family protein [Lacunisphaera sp.]|jgi:hypothetical protein|nr:YncE family protein [Lacunisphaera sp.]